ncbi:hypothetical protein [Acinetobacter bereziniae]|jgi:hypothetical protein|uniref:hypothetical protein n=1 Tax=Acinetobacter bereziniae TaxID=106648 RepID=UPI00126000E2|nr:hypothetical protein [Acinetobacter bereziniae]
MSKFYVVGAYEDFKLNIFPSHISPIIAEFHLGQYRRWAYKIEVPYKIIPTHAVGAFYDTPQQMFPYMTYSLILPKPLTQDSQIIAISKDKLLVENNRYFICQNILLEALRNIKKPAFLYRSLVSIKNALE